MWHNQGLEKSSHILQITWPLRAGTGVSGCRQLRKVWTPCLIHLPHAHLNQIVYQRTSLLERTEFPSVIQLIATGSASVITPRAKPCNLAVPSALQSQPIAGAGKVVLGCKSNFITRRSLLRSDGISYQFINSATLFWRVTACRMQPQSCTCTWLALPSKRPSVVRTKR